MESKIAEINENWEKELSGFWKESYAWYKLILKKMKNFIKWYWFHPAKTSGDQALHIIVWIFVTFGIIGWYNLAFGL